MEILSEEGAIDEASALNARVEDFKRERKAVIDVRNSVLLCGPSPTKFSGSLDTFLILDD